MVDYKAAIQAILNLFNSKFTCSSWPKGFYVDEKIVEKDDKNGYWYHIYVKYIDRPLIYVRFESITLVYDRNDMYRDLLDRFLSYIMYPKKLSEPIITEDFSMSDTPIQDIIKERIQNDTNTAINAVIKE